MSALVTLVCCLPLGFATAALSASLSAAIEPLRPWLLGSSALLLGIGVYQVYRSEGTCQRRSPISMVLLWFSAVVVLLVILFPQLLAGLLADWLP
jgi:hypothetical protein